MVISKHYFLYLFSIFFPLLKELQNFDFKMKPSIIVERSTSAPPPGLIDPVRIKFSIDKKSLSYTTKEMLNQMRLQLQNNIMIIIIH